jgi:hypothetical protein
MFSVGRLLARGPYGRWLWRADAALGLVPGRYFLDGLVAGPQLSLGRVFTGEYLELPGQNFAEFYPAVGAAGYAYGRWRSHWAHHPRGFSFMPAVSAGAGARVYARGSADPGFFTVDVLFEYRFGLGGSRLLIRISDHRR